LMFVHNVFSAGLVVVTASNSLDKIEIRNRRVAFTYCSNMPTTTGVASGHKEPGLTISSASLNP